MLFQPYIFGLNHKKLLTAITAEVGLKRVKCPDNGMVDAIMSFPKDSHHKSYVCNHVFDQTRPILLVSRPDGDWCFLCGESHPQDASAYKVAGIGHVLDQDPSLLQLSDLPPNWGAERKGVGEEWVRSQFDPE